MAGKEEAPLECAIVFHLLLREKNNRVEFVELNEEIADRREGNILRNIVSDQ